MFRRLAFLAPTASASVLLLLSCLTAPLAALGDDGVPESASTGNTKSRSKWLDPGEWRPSVGVAFGITYRDVSGTVDGSIRTAGTANTDPNGNFVIDTSETDRWPNTSVTIDLSGPTIPLDFQLMAPAFDALPTKPRLFLEGGYIFNLSKTKVAGSAGFEEADFGLPGQNVQGRVEQEVDAQNSWYVGLGMAFELPLEEYDARIGVSVRYHQDQIRLTRKLLINDPGGVYAFGGVWRQLSPVEQTINEVMPGVSFEFDLGRRGPILFGVYLNTFFGIPIDDEPLSTSIQNEYPGLAAQPDVGSMDYYFSSDSVSYNGSVGLRFSWVGE